MLPSSSHLSRRSLTCLWVMGQASLVPMGKEDRGGCHRPRVGWEESYSSLPLLSEFPTQCLGLNEW
jgi:hypothetical protein